MIIYKKPYLYNTIFGYRNINRECNFLIKIFRKYSKINVKKILDIACGTSQHGLYLIDKGYNISGLDKSREMIDCLKKMAKERNTKICLYRKDMKKFELNERFDACICMLASFHYLLSNKDIISHLKSVASILRKGGLYIIELENPKDYITKEKSTKDEWDTKNGRNIHIKIQKHGINYIDETYNMDMIITGDEKSISTHKFRMLFPQEFKLLVENVKKFELLNYFGDFDIHRKLDKSSWRMIAVLRKK